ncbi:MAG: hypothetical protein A3F84_15925 [Candidatus Handelsmanbacteria bacterium RIFCSPLOWO2_12_FULL_64_10]|uniref:Urate oxidase N-terminal domain-containing protein n=1 Tax=Handelsmanbacteria sp. (strain RIFCSPLOWO2_12_FULL_64_10) TaxID=1817868 RepID=A0A1F6CC18_HANXR|nr:MAG: hypothetical protein A3F84_15925 [Candidatus Handelsmanbacteria bacterium RIFCSPLOWO2_12_FULL_64_10]
MTPEEIVEAVLRWTHVIAAILWIGQTWLFIFFERNIRRREGSPHDALWMVHGGGYYYLEKQPFSAATPGKLHWFFGEAAVTWLTGAALMGMVIYKESTLIGLYSDFEYSTAVASGLGVVFGGFVVYSILLRTLPAKSGPLFALLALAGAAGAHYGLLQVMEPRPAFFHVGAAFGTIMAFNVVMGIIPAQKKILRALAEGREPDPKAGALGPLRSKHNSFLGVPVVFVMISSHYPLAYSTWVIVGIVLAGFAAAWLLRRK